MTIGQFTVSTSIMAGKKNKVSKFTPELFQTVLNRVSTGETLRAIARDMGFDEGSYRWHIANDDERSTRYARAREQQAEAWADQIIEQSDLSTYDTTTKNGEEVCDHEWIARSKLKVDTRKWLMAKLHPKVYSEKIKQEVTGAEGGPIVFTWQQ